MPAISNYMIHLQVTPKQRTFLSSYCSQISVKLSFSFCSKSFLTSGLT
jgi:hypothetical protein